MRNSAYRSAYAKADEASKSLRLEQTRQTKEEEEDSLVFADDDEDHYKALERTRKLALKKQEAEASGPQAIALLATSTLCIQIADDKNTEIGESLEKNMSSLRWKSLSQLSILLKMTLKEALCMISHKFHGKGPGKMKQYQEELKLKQMKNQDTPSLSVERMREAQAQLNTPIQAQLNTPYLVLSSHVKPGDPRSGFATVDKVLPGGLTPMLGDKKVEHFLGIKRKLETENSSAHQRSLKFGSVVEIFCWRTHGTNRDSENLRSHYSVSLTLKGTHSDGYGYFSICFGTV